MDDDDHEVEPHLLAHSDEVESLLRERRAHVRVCAWCDSVCIAGEWYGPSSLLSASWRVDRRTSHTICPDCFDRILPGVPYPGS